MTTLDKDLDYCIIYISPQEIDKINIQARMEVFNNFNFYNIIYIIQSYSFVKIRLLFDLFFYFIIIKQKVLTWLIIYKMKKLKYLINDAPSYQKSALTGLRKIKFTTM